MQQVPNIRLYMFLRLVMLFSVLISMVLSQFSGAFTNDIIVQAYSITFFTFLVTTIFIFLYEKARSISYFLSSQMAYDLLFTTVLIFYTDPYDSMYTVFYFFNIIFAAVLFRRRGALITALLSSGLYALVMWLNSDHARGDRSFSLLTTLTAFVAIALLGGQLMDELRKSRIKISRLEELNEEIVDSLDSGLIGIGADGLIQKINRTGQQMLGISDATAAIGKRLHEVLPALNEINGGEVREMLVLGRMRRMLVTRVNLPEKLSMILLRDLTEILNLEEKIRRQERLAGVGRLAAGVAHEIRNPIASISGAAQILQDGGSDENERLRLMALIIRESERVDRLVGQLLRFARPKVVARETVDLAMVIRDSVEALKARPDYKTSFIEIQSDLPRSLPMSGNRDELSEVIMNLLVNAMQALAERKRPGQKLLSIQGTKSRGSVQVTVSDNGPGIPKEFKGRIFDPFFTTKSNGTGLGLAQVDKIVRDHDGQIDLDTEEGKGTALKIRLPA